MLIDHFALCIMLHFISSNHFYEYAKIQKINIGELQVREI